MSVGLSNVSVLRRGGAGLGQVIDLFSKEES